MSRIVLLTDPREFLGRASALLAADPAVSTIVATTVHHKIARLEAGVAPDPRDWWLVVEDEAGVAVGLGMGQPPGELRQIYLLQLPEDALEPLAEALAARSVEISLVNGVRPTVDRFAALWAERRHTRVVVDAPIRLYELGALIEPPPVSGRLRAPLPDELPLVARWLSDFHAEAAIQGGRDVPPDSPVPDDLAEQVAVGRFAVWADGGHPVHLTGHQPARFGVARIGPVYTPAEFRGHGYAAAAVATISRQLRQTSRVCLFTDFGNPVSNALYERLGYVPVADMVNLDVTAAAPRPDRG